jgi:hypothetical protein
VHPATSEAPPSNKVPAVKGVAAEGWLDARSVLTAKATSVTAKITNVTTRAAEMATKASSGVSCRHSRWGKRQAQSDRRHRYDMSQPLHFVMTPNW